MFENYWHTKQSLVTLRQVDFLAFYKKNNVPPHCFPKRHLWRQSQWPKATGEIAEDTTKALKMFPFLRIINTYVVFTGKTESSTKAYYKWVKWYFHTRHAEVPWEYSWFFFLQQNGNKFMCAHFFQATHKMFNILMFTENQQ